METSLQIQTVLYKNEKEALEKSLKSIANACRVDKEEGKTIKRLVVSYGDASPEPLYTEEEIQKLAEKYQSAFSFQYRYFNENTGSAKGQNLLAWESDCEYLLIMNPDVILCPTFFGRMMERFSVPGVGIVEARQTPIEHAKDYDTQTGETEWATGACSMIPRKVFEEVGGFDHETFFMYCDDVDLSWRVRLAGYTILYQPKAVCYHAKRLSAEGDWEPTPAEVYYSAEAAVLMAHKYSNPKRVAYLLDQFSSSGDTERKVVEAYRERAATGRLPKPIDPAHKVARFVGDYFTDQRYFLV